MSDQNTDFLNEGDTGPQVLASEQAGPRGNADLFPSKAALERLMYKHKLTQSGGLRHNWHVWVLLFGAYTAGFLYTNRDVFTDVYPYVDWGSAVSGLLFSLVGFCVFMVLLFLSFKVHIVLHEIGHMLAGFMRGMRLMLLNVGKWQYELTVTGYRWRKAGMPLGVGGVAVMVPDVNRARVYSRVDRVVYAVGGPVMNLVCGGVICWLLYRYGKPGLAWENVFFYMFAGMALLCGVVNLLPFKTQGWHTDGRQILETIFRKDDRLLRQIMWLSGLSVEGSRPKQWPVTLLPGDDDVNRTGEEFTVLYSAQQLRLAYALDTNDEKMAQGCARWLVERFHLIPDGVSQQMAFLLAVYAVQCVQDKALLAAWRPLCDEGLVDMAAGRLWLDGELALMDGDLAMAERCLLQSRQALADVMSVSEQEIMEERLCSLERGIRRAHV